MRRIIISLFALLGVVMASNAQILYKISGNGLQKPSYLLGTYHFASSSFVDSIPGFNQAMKEVQQVCGEIEMSQMNKPDVLVRLQEAMNLPEGTTLSSLLNEEELSALNATLKSLLGADLTNPVVGAQLGKMTPAAINMQLTSLMYLKRNPNFNMNDGIDNHVQQLARKSNKPVLSLETVDEQIYVLLKSQSLERGKQLLMCMVRNQDYMMTISSQIVDAYYAQDLDKIKELMDEENTEGCENTEEELGILIYDRNAKWMTKMPDIMAAKSTLFAFGAGHLIGDKGLLTLLKQAGYQVEAVK